MTDWGMLLGIMPFDFQKMLEPMTVWCCYCYRSINSHPLANSLAPCPYCGSTAMKLHHDPLS